MHKINSFTGSLIEAENSDISKDILKEESSGDFLSKTRWDFNTSGYTDLYLNDDFLTNFTLPRPFAWDWPFSDDGMAKGEYTEEKFFVCLPFSVGGGTGERNGNTKKVEKISESNFSWTIGLSTNASNPYEGNAFWRIELEIIRSLNMLVLIVTRDISYHDDKTKRLKTIRKVYKLPYIYDVSTLSTKNEDLSVSLEARRRRDVRTNKLIPFKRSESCVS